MTKNEIKTNFKVKMQDVNSSAIESVGIRYNDVYIQFKTGAVYRYPNARYYNFKKLISAPSVGSYFLNNFKKKFTGERIAA